MALLELFKEKNFIKKLIIVDSIRIYILYGGSFVSGRMMKSLLQFQKIYN